MRHVSKRHHSAAEEALDARLPDDVPVQVTARRYSGTPLVCDQCGRTATKSTAGGRDGHTMLCSLCAGDEPQFEDFSGIGVTSARADLPLAEYGSTHTAESDYPELDGILWSRPDLIEATPVAINSVSLGSKTARRVEGNDLKRTIEDPDQPWWWRKVVGPALDRVNDNLDVADNEIDFSKSPRPDNWCRFRRDGNCFYPKELDAESTAEAGYPVWQPFNRGTCYRVKRVDQKDCEVSEPGPNSGERLTAPDATYSWAQGGQRRSSSKTSAQTKFWHGTMHRFSPGDTLLPANRGSHDARWPETNPDLAYAMKNVDDAWQWADKEYENHVWHEHDGEYLACSCQGPFVYEVSPLDPSDIVDEDRPWSGVQSPSGFRVNRKLDEKMTRWAAWTDVNQKATRIRRDGGVRIISNTGATVTAEVNGDNGLYTTTITRVPGSKAVGMWYCSCPWSKYAWDRSEPWKKYEGRKCAHATALLYEMQANEMFGGEIHEVPEKPTWRTEDPTLDRRDGETPVDYGAQVYEVTSSKLTPTQVELSLGNIRDAALAAASQQDGESHDRLIAHAAAASEDRQRAVRLDLRRHGAFSGQVGGRIRSDLELREDGMIEAGSQILHPSSVLYPTFDPSAGLNFVGSRAPSPAGRAALLDVSPAGISLSAAMDSGLDELMLAMRKGNFTHAGLIIKSSASGRVLLTQRTPFHGDDEETYGKWEFPGGGLDDGETALDGAVREFEEETGLTLPEGFSVDGHYENGIYVAIVITVPDESWTVNADLLDLETMGIGWFDTEMIEDSEGFVRPELLRVDFDMVREAVVKTADFPPMDTPDWVSTKTSTKKVAWDEQDQYESDMNKAFWSGQAEIARERDDAKRRTLDMKGQEIEVVKGRKVPKGTRGVVFWVGEGKWGWRVGFKDESGQEHWTDIMNVGLVSELSSQASIDEDDEDDDFIAQPGFWAGDGDYDDHDFDEAREMGRSSILQPEPEPVLEDGVAYGADDPDDESIEAEASTSVDALPFVPGDPRLSHLAGGGDADANEDIASAAAAFLKQSVKTFSPAEQQALIDEGGFIGAGNDDMLQIEGTFYEDQMTDEIGWM